MSIKVGEEENVETATAETENIDKGNLNNKPVKKVSGIVITDPAFGGYRIHRSYGKIQVDQEGKKNSLTNMENFQQALGYIFEMRVVNELQGEMTLLQYNLGVKKIQDELTMASGGEKK